MSLQTEWEVTNTAHSPNAGLKFGQTVAKH